MKIYEKPMAMIEKIEVEDVITASGDSSSDAITVNSTASSELANAAGTDAAIVFEW